MFSHIALATLMAAAPQTSPKHGKNARQVATPPATPPKGPNVVRRASCVLTLKGSLTRVIQVPKPLKRAGGATPPAASTTTNEISERFDYELPGTLDEETDPRGIIRFIFTPADDFLRAGARGTLYFQDSGSGTSGPTVLDSSEVTSIDPFIFEANGRGQGIVPGRGYVYLRGRVRSPLPSGGQVSMVAPSRPLISVPLPPIQNRLNPNGVSALRFQGASLWAWQNSKGPFTVTATMDYQGPTAVGQVTGTVEVSFRVGATEKDQPGEAKK